jgi:hypothetical protein
LLSRCNDVGLLAGEFDPLTGRMLGNFPQAYSHVGLINCAFNLSRQAGSVEERPRYTNAKRWLTRDVGDRWVGRCVCARVECGLDSAASNTALG